ncbi:MAG: hypothetical protein HGA33_05995 [Candidatus Moranbacteria bacterium]|nr:hypothetical protein [Candidatus Moranbacteria bacterium]
MLKTIKTLAVAIMLTAIPVVGVMTTSVAEAATYQAPASASLTVMKQGGGNAVVSWQGLSSVAVVEHYVGNGQKWGFVKSIKVPAGATSVVLGNIAKNGGRFNLQMQDGTYLHLECGGNPETTMPQFTGCHVDCSWIDPATGQPAGALEID